MSKLKTRKVAAEIRAILEAVYPLVFVGKGAQKKPLRIGIHKDIRREMPGLSTWKIRTAVADYVHGPRYARCLVEGADRIGLDGKPDGVVTKAQAERAAADLAKWAEEWRQQDSPIAKAA